MYWILAAICLLIAFAVPRLRPAGIVGCVLLFVMLGWGMIQRWRAAGPSHPPAREAPVTPGSSLGSFPLDAVSASQLQLTGGGAPFQLRGQLANASRDWTLRSVTLQVTRRDCFSGALDPSGCDALWQTQQWISLSVPPQEMRHIATSIWAHGSAPRIRGTAQDSFKIVAATGEPAAEAAGSSGNSSEN